MKVFFFFLSVFFAIVPALAQTPSSEDVPEVANVSSKGSSGNWPKSSDELLAMSRIDFDTKVTRRRIDLHENTHIIYGDRTGGFCVSGSRPIDTTRVSDTEVKINVFPKKVEGKQDCYGFIIKINTQKKTFAWYEYYGDPSNLRGPFGFSKLRFSN